MDIRLGPWSDAMTAHLPTLARRCLSLALLLGTSCTNELAVFARTEPTSPDADTPIDASTDADAADADSGHEEPELPEARSITAFEHTCAILDGRLYCWGDNRKFQLGLGDNEIRSEPTPVAAQSSFREVCAGDSHTCALRSDGIVLCWGDNFNGALGVGDNDPRDRPTPIGTMHFAKLACWSNVSCGIGLEGALFCWGDNFEGQLGQSDATGSPSRSSPTAVAPQLRFREVAVGQGHVCAITAGGELYCWGRNTEHQLGARHDQAQVRTPTRVDAPRLYRRVTAGMVHSCAIERSGQLFCWGAEGAGHLGLGLHEGARVSVPTQVGSEGNYTQVHASWFHTCALRSNGFLSCWGRNVEGQLGLADSNNRNLPARVGTASDWLEAATGRFHSCGVRGDGVYCWGENDELSQLGLGVPGRRAEPTLLTLPSR